MSRQSERLERLIADREGECCAADIDARVETLERHVADLPSDAARDRAALTTLSNDTRYTIVRLLAAAGRELCVCEITPVVDVSDSAVSHALSDLDDAGLVTRRKDGTWRYYEATDRATLLAENFLVQRALVAYGLARLRLDRRPPRRAREGRRKEADTAADGDDQLSRRGRCDDGSGR